MQNKLDGTLKIASGQFLIYHSQRQICASLKTTIRSLGSSKSVAVKTWDEAQHNLELRNFTHILFESRGTDRKSLEFAERAIKSQPEAVLMGLFEPAYVDQFFEMLHIGVRGFLVVPCNAETLEEALLDATMGLSIPDGLLSSGDRNEALTNLVIRKLDLYAATAKQLRDSQWSSSSLVNRSQGAFFDSMDLASRFFRGSKEEVVVSIAKACTKVAREIDAQAQTRLGKLRRQLAVKRGVDPKDEEEKGEG